MDKEPNFLMPDGPPVLVGPSGKTPFRDRSARRRNFVVAPGDEVVTDLLYREDVWHRDQGICQICMTEIPDQVGRRGPLSFDIDHVDPLGDHTLSNVRATHSFCNQSKSRDDYDPEVPVARARLALALAKRTPKKASAREVTEELQWGPGRRPSWWRRAAIRAWTKAGGKAVADRDEYIENVRYWADRLPQEVGQYLVWMQPSDP